jgi:transcriptional regulator with GAF, ATPase, and Fis domain
VVESVEKRMITEALVSTNWVQTKAAEAIGVSERMLRYKMKKLSIAKEGGGSSGSADGGGAEP